MKKKDTLYLVLALVILLVAGIVAYTQFFKPKPTATDVTKNTVEVVGLINSDVNQSAITQLNDPAQVQDYTPAIDLTGLNNQTPFTP